MYDVTNLTIYLPLIRIFLFVKNKFRGVIMSKEKTQIRRIIETYVTVIVLVISAILILSGIAISKINTDYMETGVRAGKIVAERENTEISIITHDGIEIKPENDINTINKFLTLLPPPINTTFLIYNEITENFPTK